MKGSTIKKLDLRLLFSGLIPLFVLAHFGHHVVGAMLRPLVPMIRTDFNLNYTEAGILLSAFAVTRGISQLPMGWLADRFGTRIMVVLGVSGIGPRSALTMLSYFTPERLKTAIAREEADVLAQVPGVGPKTARRIIFQLKDKVTVEAFEISPLADQDAEVIAALTALGYSVVEAQTAVQRLPRDPDMPIEERVRLALASFA